MVRVRDRGKKVIVKSQGGKQCHENRGPQAPVGRHDENTDQKSECDRGGVHSDLDVGEDDDHNNGGGCSVAQGRLEQWLVHAADCS